MPKNSSQQITIEQIEKLLQQKLQDQAKMLRKEIHEDIQEEIRFSEARTDIKLMKMEQRIDDNARKYRDEILTRTDATMGELETIRQEQLLMNEDLNNLKKDLKN